MWPYDELLTNETWAEVICGIFGHLLWGDCWSPEELFLCFIAIHSSWLLQGSREFQAKREKAHASTPAWALPTVFILEHLHALWVLLRDFPGAQMVKNLPAMLETWIPSLGQEDSLKKGMAIHSSILAWRIPWTEEPGRLQSMGSQWVRHDWTTITFHFKGYSADGSLRVCNF